MRRLRHQYWQSWEAHFMLRDSHLMFLKAAVSLPWTVPPNLCLLACLLLCLLVCLARRCWQSIWLVCANHLNYLGGDNRRPSGVN